MDNLWPSFNATYRLDALTWPQTGDASRGAASAGARHGGSASNADPLRSEIERLLARIPLDFGGGCSASKAYVMASLIRELGTRMSLDIGVYRGRSLLPQAIAHLRHTGGTAYGVDPWSKQEAMENDNPGLKAEIDRFVESTDFEALYQDVDRLRQTIGVGDHCTLIRKTSAAAAAYFREQGMSFGLIHVDGNHDTAVVMQDVADYLPLLDPGGILVLDDVSWDSVKPAYAHVASRMPRLFERIDAFNDYAVFLNAQSRTPPAAAWLRLFDDEFVVRG